MAKSLAEIRAKLAALESKNTQNGGDNTIYPFWNIKANESVVLRFLPDGDDEADFFWAERQMIRLPFEGIKGGDSKPTVVTVPCVEMFGTNLRCPVLTQVREWFKTKDPELETLARKYWKKYSYIFQGFVVENTLNEDNIPENPIRRFILNRQLFKTIEDFVMHDPEVENLPTDYQQGTNFRISKTMKGEYADYTTSKFSRNETALSPDQEESIEKFGLPSLRDSLPAQPTEEDLVAIREMFEASVNREEYDPDRWQSFYRPFGFTVPDSGPSTQTSSSQNREQTRVTPKEDAVSVTPEPETPSPAPATAPASEGGNSSVDDILATIRRKHGGE